MIEKKIITASIILLGLVAIVIAQGIGEGVIINQQQLDSVNASDINLQCQLEDIGQNHLIYNEGSWYYYRNVSCLSINPIDINNPSNEYVIIRPHHFPYFLVSDYFVCRQDNTPQYCNDFYTNILIENHQFRVEAIRNRIRQFQSIEGNTGNTDFGDGFEL